MNGYRIPEAACATGFSVSALRFYEQKCVVVPERTATEYRNYGDDDIAALRFVARGKQLGLSLRTVDVTICAGAVPTPTSEHRPIRSDPSLRDVRVGDRLFAPTRPGALADG